MRSKNDVLNKLEELTKQLKEKGGEITEVYFFDHGGSDRPWWNPFKKTYFAQFGADEVYVVEREKFWKKLGKAVPATATLNFRHCVLGARVERLAKLTGRTVTAVDGLLDASDPYPNNVGPDYIFKGDLLEASYDENGIIQVDTIWSQYAGTETKWEYHIVIYWHDPMIVLLPVEVPIPNSEPNPY